jgi:hypothetical protein
MTIFNSKIRLCYDERRIEESGILHLPVCHLDEGEILMLRASRSLVVR